MSISNKDKKRVVLTAILSVMIIAVAAVPLLATSTDDPPEIIYEDDPLGGIESTVRWVLAIPWILGGTAIANFGYWILGDGQYVPTGSLPNEVQAFAREREKATTQESIILISRMGANLINNDRQTLALSQLHMNRAAEITAAMLWAENTQYDANAVLLESGIIELLSNANFNNQTSLDWAFNQGANRVRLWAEADNWATGLQIQLVWNGGGTGFAADSLNLDFTTIMYAGTGTSASGMNMFYLDTDSMSGDPINPLNNSVYHFGTGGAFTHIETNTPRTVYPGSNDVSSWPSGWYWATSGTYAGPFLPAAAPNRSALLEGGAVIDCDGSYGYVTADDSGILEIVYNNITHKSSFIDYSISSDGRTLTTTAAAGESDIVSGIIIEYAKYYEQITKVITGAANAGLTMWMISAQAKSSNILLSPSSVVPQLENLTIDPIQAYAIYVAALDQISSYWYNNGTILRAGNVSISETSLMLYCYGSIYNPDGSVIAENVIFTPYVYVRNMNISKFAPNIYTQPGTIMIWDTEATTANGWQGVNVTEPKLVTVSPGTFFNSTEIYYKGYSYNDITLQVRTIQTTNIFTNAQLGIVDSPNVLNVIILFMLIFVLLGANIIQLGMMFRSGGVVLVGIVIIAVGFLFADLLARFMISSGWFGFLYARLII